MEVLTYRVGCGILMLSKIKDKKMRQGRLKILSCGFQMPFLFLNILQGGS